MPNLAKYLRFSELVRKPTKACQPAQRWQSTGNGSQKTHTEYTQIQKLYSLMPQLCKKKKKKKKKEKKEKKKKKKKKEKKKKKKTVPYLHFQISIILNLSLIRTWS